MNNAISIQGYTLTIHSGEPMVEDLELARRLGFAEPRAIRKLIKRLLERGMLKKEQMRDTVSRLPNGAESTSFHLGEKAALKVITKSETENADQITDEMIDVFIDYRAGKLQPRNPQPQDLATLLISAGEELRKKDLKIEQMTPKVEFVDRYVESNGNKGFRQVAKILKAKENEFREFLRAEKIMYRLGGSWTAHQPHIDAGRFHMSTGEDNGHAFTTAKFTPKGVEWIAAKWAVKNLARDNH